MRAESEESFLCAWCGELNEITIDVSGGTDQSLVIDCEVCCRPNHLTVRIDVVDDSFTIEASRES